MTRWMMLNGEYVRYHTHPEQLYAAEDGTFMDEEGTVYRKHIVPQSVRYNIEVYLTNDKLTITEGFGRIHRLARAS